MSLDAYNISHLASRSSELPPHQVHPLESFIHQCFPRRCKPVVLGRSDPVTALLKKEDAPVTQCHSRNKGLECFVRWYERGFNGGLLMLCCGSPKKLMWSSLRLGGSNL